MSMGNQKDKNSSGRPVMPVDYGISKEAKGQLPWDWVSNHMASSRNYWISSTRPDGRPHAMPVWGVWVDNVLYFGTARRSRKAINLAANPAVSVHTESGDDAVIIEGVVKEVTNREIFNSVTAATARKYPGMPAEAEPDPGTIWFAVRASVVFAWREQDFPTSATRWQFS